MEIIPFSRFRFEPFKDRLKKVVYIQAPEKFSALVQQYYDYLIMEEDFLVEISRRMGSVHPEEIFWIKVVKECVNNKIPVKLIEPDIDFLIKRVAKKLNLGKNKDKIIQETRNWYLLGVGYPRLFYLAFDKLFFWLPYKDFFRRSLFRILAKIVSVVPGDQRDMISVVVLVDDELSKALAKKLKGKKRGVAFIDEEISHKVERFLAEM